MISALVAGLRPARPLRRRDGAAWAVLAIALGAAGMIAAFGLRNDLLGGRPPSLFLLSSGLFLVLAIASAWAVVEQAQPYVGIRREGWGWTAMMAAVLPLSAAVLVGIDWFQGIPLRLDRGGIDCLGYGIVWGMFTATALVLWLRRGAPTAPLRAGLLTGVAAGSAGVFAVSLHCPSNDILHIGVWHGCTVILCGVLGRLIVPRLIAW